MKPIKTLTLLVLGLLMFASIGWAQSSVVAPKSAIAGSAHDFRSGIAGSTTTWSTVSYGLCNFCHIAHKLGASPSGPGYLLWNHTISSTSSYGVYSSDSMLATPTDLGSNNTPSNLTVSNLCLSCHDGTVAINSYYESVGSAGSATATFMPASFVVNDLTKQHPVNFTYPTGAPATTIGLLVPASTSSVDGAGQVPLFNGKMQCATCHDAHNSASHIFLRTFPTTAATTSTGSFCVYCHT